MMGNKSTGRLGHLAAWASAAILVIASVAFAAPSYAAPGDPGQGQSAHRQTHKQANQHKHAASTARNHAVGNTTSDNQGSSAVSLPRPNNFQAQSDPDGMENGGVDQPGGQGGIDTTTQDGNNGSGNDTDCEDDNNGVGVPGHCKDRPGHVTPPTDENPGTDNPGTDNPGTPGTDIPGTDTPIPGTDVAGPVLQPVVAGPAVQVDAPGVFAASATPTQAKAAPAAGVLPNTGAGQALLALAIAGLAGLGLGVAMLRQGRRTARVTG